MTKIRFSQRIELFNGYKVDSLISQDSIKKYHKVVHMKMNAMEMSHLGTLQSHPDLVP